MNNKIKHYLSSLWLMHYIISVFCFIFILISFEIIKWNWLEKDNQINKTLFNILYFLYFIFYLAIIFDLINNFILSIKKIKKSNKKTLWFFYDWSEQSISKKYWIIYLNISNWIWIILVILFNSIGVALVSLFFSYNPIFAIVALVLMSLSIVVKIYGFIQYYARVNFKQVK